MNDVIEMQNPEQLKTIGHISYLMHAVEPVLKDPERIYR